MLISVLILILGLILFRKVIAKPNGSVSFAISVEGPQRPTRRDQRRAQLNRSYNGPELWQCDGSRLDVFQYATEAASGELEIQDLLAGRPIAVLDFETTGINPIHKHRVIEVALTLISATGSVEEVFCTLINPNMAIENTIYHGITTEMVQSAPSMKEVLPYILALLESRIVVAHNAPFEEMFLFHEAQRAGITLGKFAAVDTLSLARACLDLPNHKLQTICKYLGIELSRAHEADADSYAAGMLYLDLIKRKNIGLRGLKKIGREKIDLPARPRRTSRPPKVSKGKSGYMASLIGQLPGSQLDLNSQAESLYVAALERALSDGKLTKPEAQSLADLAAPLGLRGSRIMELNQSFLEAAYTAATSDAIVTDEELVTLSKLASELGRPNFFDSVRSTSAAVQTAMDKAPATARRRCGHCQKVGHTRRSCPDLSQ